MLGSSGAGRIREISDLLNLFESLKYKFIFYLFPKLIRQFYDWNFETHGFKQTYAQLSCLKILLKKKGNEYKRGEAVLDTTWSKKDKQMIIHAVGMSYKLTGEKPIRIAGTKATIKKAVESTIKIVKEINTKGMNPKSIAIPVMNARKSYGIAPKDSFDVIMKILKKLEGTSIKKIILCFDNDESKLFLDKILKKK